MGEERKKISASSIAWSFVLLSMSIWAFNAKCSNAGLLFLIMAVVFGITAIFYVLSNRGIVLVATTVMMLVVGAVLIAPIGGEAMNELFGLVVNTIIDSVDLENIYTTNPLP